MLLLFGAVLACAGVLNAGKMSTFAPFDQLRQEYKLSNGRSIFVFDGALPEENLLTLHTFMSTNDHWRYVLRDPHSTSPEGSYDDRNGIPWKSWTDPTLLGGTAVMSKLKNLVQDADVRAKSGEIRNFEVNEIYSALIRRGDRTKVQKEIDSGEGYSVAIFNNIVWRKNAYGELLFYDDDGEILATIRPKFGRVVVWHSTISYIFRPPSISQLTTESITFINFGANATENRQKLRYFQNFVEKLKNPPPLTSVLEDISTKKDVTDKNIKNHLTLLRRNRRNHFVAVFDDLFDEAALSTLRSWTIKYGLYYFDGSIDANSDNVQWIAAINVDNFVRTQFWPTIQKVAKFVSNTSDWYPYDVACNLIRSYDHTRFHLDTSHSKEKEMTFLLYLSPNWTASDYGETAFMETNDDNPRNEYVAEVVPTFGRAVIFDGNFPHSAHPPSVMHYNARYTLAVKLSYTKMLAVKKTFSEESRHEPNIGYSLTEVIKLSRFPEAALANRKVIAVAEHLSSRNIINEISSAGGEDREEMEEDNGQHEEGDDLANEEEDDDENRHIAEGDMYQEEMDGKYEEFSAGRGERDGGFEGLSDEDVENGELEMYMNSLTRSQKRMVGSMVRHHRLNEKLSAIMTDNNVEMEGMSIFDPEKRQTTLMRWQRMASRDPDALNDFLELYLRQVAVLKDFSGRKIIALL